MQGIFVDFDAETRRIWHAGLSILNRELWFGDERIRSDDAKPENKLTGRHHQMRGRARVEMYRGSGFQLAEGNESADIQ